MRRPEEHFRRRREADWRRLAELLRRERGGRLAEDDVVRLYRLYAATVRDLAWSRQYGSARLQQHLNSLAAEADAVVQRAPEGTWRRLGRFYSRGLPRTIVRLARYIEAAAGAFGLGVVLGFAAVHWGGSGWASTVLPKSLHPAYQGRHVPLRLGVETASEIYINNVLVSLEAFGLGIAAALPTLYVLWGNGLLLGGLFGLFLARGLSLTFWSLILPHGVLELFAVFLAGAGGLRLGWAWIRPGDLARSAALRAAGRDAVRLLLGIVPLLGIAALIEGLVTPSALDPWLKLGVGCVDAAGLVVYVRRGLGDH